MSEKVSIPHRDRPGDGMPPKKFGGSNVARQPDDMKGMFDGPTSADVQNGVPYGDQLEKERRETAIQHAGLGDTSRLRAATRKALGRG